MTDHDPFADLPRRVAPPPELRDRVLGDLRRRGLVDSRVTQPVRVILALAAAIALFAGGAWYGAARTGAPAPDGRSFALMLYEPAGFAQGAEGQDFSAEYRAWAQSLGDRYVDGNELGAMEVVGGEVGGPSPSGYFIVRVSDRAAAVALAAASPHAGHGGVVAVHELVE